MSVCMELVAALRDPSHPERASMKQWAPDDFEFRAVRSEGREVQRSREAATARVGGMKPSTVGPPL